MAKENKVKIVKEPKATMSDVLKAISDMNSNLNTIAGLLVKTPETLGTVARDLPSAPSQLQPTVQEISKQQDTKFPVPLEFREVVDVTLNKRFGIDIEYKSENASFAFSILVPKEYSDATPAYLATHGEDRRTKVILNALGSNGVREWATKVFNSFSPETKSKIVFDRSQVN